MRHGHTRERQEDPREVDLRHEPAIGHDARAGEPHRAREVRPRQERRVREDRIRHAVRREVGEPAEDEREDDHREEGLEDRPGHPDGRLLVAHRDVAPDERSQQLAVVPQLPDVEVRPARRGANRRHSVDARRRLKRLGGGSLRAVAHLQLGVSHAADASWAVGQAVSASAARSARTGPPARRSAARDRGSDGRAARDRPHPPRRTRRRTSCRRRCSAPGTRRCRPRAHRAARCRRRATRPRARRRSASARRTPPSTG